jgi:hypothetical protein
MKQISYLEFISKATNDTSLVTELFGEYNQTKEQIPEEELVKLERLRSFMESFEKKNTDASYK